MAEHGFVEVETPYLTRSTPEGARDFLVPVRLQPGHWYALPQSPQLFKQLLMVAGLERYYQIVRCFRDEDFRADRQPEFTQLDIEMSFVDQDDVIALGEEVVARVWRELAGYEVPLPIPRMTYADAMARFGSDKPDLRFGCELVDLTAYFADTPFRVFQAPYVGAVVMPGGAAQTRKELDGWQDWAKARGAAGSPTCWCRDGELGGPIAKNLSEAERAGLAAAAGAQPGDAVFFAAGGAAEARATARRAAPGDRPALRPHRPRRLGASSGSSMRRCSSRDGAGGWTAVHHPFTAPQPEWAATFQDDPGRSRRPTTSSSTARRSVAARSVSIAGDAAAGLRRHRAHPATRRSRSSASCSRRSPTGRRRTAASRWAGTGWSRCWPATTRSAR